MNFETFPMDLQIQGAEVFHEALDKISRRHAAEVERFILGMLRRVGASQLSHSELSERGVKVTSTTRSDALAFMWDGHHVGTLTWTLMGEYRWHDDPVFPILEPGGDYRTVTE